MENLTDIMLNYRGKHSCLKKRKPVKGVKQFLLSYIHGLIILLQLESQFLYILQYFAFILCNKHIPYTILAPAYIVLLPVLE